MFGRLKASAKEPHCAVLISYLVAISSRKTPTRLGLSQFARLIGGGAIELPARQTSIRTDCHVRGVSESLDVNTVLREVVESACALTGAGLRGITTMDGSGRLKDFVTSGLSPEEHQRFLELPHAPGLWDAGGR